jgi:CheY-like chemotaxis protein
VLLNLIFNAVDAMPLPTQRRIFEPFFTTKADVGTGLGLATAYASIKSWGGDIAVESALGRGTTSISLPAWRGAMPAAETPDAIITPMDEGPARILIAEDESIIAMMLVNVLESAGHQVEQAQDGLQALELFAPNRYDIALLDLGMPQLPGDELWRRLKECDPHIVTVLLTGWRLGESDLRRQAADFYLQKPIVASQVKKVVAQALGLH